MTLTLGAVVTAEGWTLVNQALGARTRASNGTNPVAGHDAVVDQSSRNPDPSPVGTHTEPEGYPHTGPRKTLGLEALDLIHQKAFLNGKPVTILLDTGATSSFITTDAYQKGGLRSRTISPVSVRLADGKTLTIDQKCKARLRVLTRDTEKQRYHHTPVDLYMLPRPPGEVAPPQVCVYLGTDWLYTNRAEWTTHSPPLLWQ